MAHDAAPGPGARSRSPPQPPVGPATTAAPTLADIANLLANMQASQGEILRTVQHSAHRIDAVENRMERNEVRFDQMEKRMADVETAITNQNRQGSACSTDGMSGAPDTGGTARRSSPMGDSTVGSLYIDGTLCVGGFPQKLGKEHIRSHLEKMLACSPSATRSLVMFSARDSGDPWDFQTTTRPHLR